MEEGTGLGLYILVAAILFGLFAFALALFGDQIKGYLNTLFTESKGKITDYQNEIPKPTVPAP